MAVESVPELGLNGEKDVTCLFPPDMMKYGLGSEVIIEVTGLFDKPERTREVRQHLAERLGQAVSWHVQKAIKVECLIYPPFNPKDGFWTGAPEKKKEHWLR